MDELLPSVTGEHRNVKDPSIRNFEKNEALRSFRDQMLSFRKTHNNLWPSSQEIDTMQELAADAPIIARDTAGSKGDYIHDCRERLFRMWINSGKVEKPLMTVENIARSRGDIPMDLFPEVVSGCAAIDRFIEEWKYIPLGCEILVFDAKDKVAGTLDDFGVVTLKDGQQIMVLLDVKSSNQFKDTYTLQVMRYNKMFVRLFHLKADRILIVKTGKDDRQFKLEWFTPVQMKAGNEANKHLIKFNNAWEQVQASRKKEPKIYVPKSTATVAGNPDGTGPVSEGRENQESN